MHVCSPYVKKYQVRLSKRVIFADNLELSIFSLVTKCGGEELSVKMILGVESRENCNTSQFFLYFFQ